MSDMSALCHQFVPFGTDKGEVIVLDQGSIIGPEAGAMLGALYSRSPASVREHLDVIAKRGADKFMGTYYVGYGHKSIGDMGTAYVFIENVSMLAAKAVQDFPLYNGQEVSTRYVDFATRAFLDPQGSSRSKAMLETLRAFYLHGLDVMVPVLTERYPIQEGERPADYAKAVKARAFDTMRAFLPAGASTNLVWFGELRQFADRLPILRTHPLSEIREMALAIEKGLLAAYPNSFSEKRYEETEHYLTRTNVRHAYYDTFPNGYWNYDTAGFDFSALSEFSTALESRPPKTELPYAVRDAGTMRFDFFLDFGSYRDLQRQRAVHIRMPLLTTRHGFESWYLDEMPETLRTEALKLLRAYEDDLRELRLSPAETQFYVPMGYRCPIRLTGDLRALVYLVELRATRFVHPTLRFHAKKMAEVLCGLFGDKYGLVLHLDKEPDRFDVKRGAHDIGAKE
jgi:thymidylate synthase ThyX